LAFDDDVHAVGGVTFVEDDLAAGIAVPSS
jgi:hypothetical protein